MAIKKVEPPRWSQLVVRRCWFLFRGSTIPVAQVAVLAMKAATWLASFGVATNACSNWRSALQDRASRHEDRASLSMISLARNKQWSYSA